MTSDMRAGHFFEDLSIGMEASIAHTVSVKEIEDFARVSRDVNPLHLDEDFAAATPFKERVAHGILTASYISAVLGTQLPGPGSIYVSQTLFFKAPVPIGAEVITTVKITGLIADKRRAIFDCVSRIADKAVLEGEAVLIVPSRASKK